MSKIRQLSPDQARKIAAGEVIDRPAHVVKELLENALDAGATAITVYIEQAGKQLIRVIDDGCGMSLDDARLCFAHHATSKISTIDDLLALGTFGFRGEALASIVAVSKVTLTTKEADVMHGICIVRVDQTIESERVVACNAGTDVAVHDLFYNIPVRKKFLRSNDTEWHQIQQLVSAYCLAYPHIHFKLYHDDQLRLNCPPTESPQTRIAQVWGHQLPQQSLVLEPQTREGVVITGVISDHQYTRYDRNHIMMFVNNRWVKNQGLVRAFINGYRSVLPEGKFPVGVIHITCDPAELDVNIHPRKEEVQFLHPRIVEQLIQQAVSDMLEKHMTSAIRQTQAVGNSVSRPMPEFFAANTAWPVAYEKVPLAPQVPGVHIFDTPLSALQQTVLPSTALSSAQSDNESDFFNIIGQLHTTYVIIEHPDGLMLIDQHAAHERIMYEKFVVRVSALEPVALLFPVAVNVNAQELELLETHLTVLYEYGVGVRVLGPTSLVVSACPVICKNIDWSDFIKQMLVWIAELGVSGKNDAVHKALTERVRAQMACKAAVKAGDVLTQEQMQQLVRDLMQTTNRLTCPHGRPTSWLLNMYEIEKRFKRVV